MKRVNFPLVAVTALTILMSGQAFAGDVEGYPESAIGTNQNIDPESAFVNWEVLRNRPSAMPEECLRHDCALSYGLGKLHDELAIWTITLPRSAGKPADCKFNFCHSESAFSSEHDFINYDKRRESADSITKSDTVVIKSFGMHQNKIAPKGTLERCHNPIMGDSITWPWEKDFKDECAEIIQKEANKKHASSLGSTFRLRVDNSLIGGYQAEQRTIAIR